MPTNVIMPALELAQETGKVLRWIKAPGDKVRKGEPIVEIETDKVTVEIESPASGILSNVTAHEGDVIPVGHTIALITAAGEAPIAPARPSPCPLPGGERERQCRRLLARGSLDLPRWGEGRVRGPEVRGPAPRASKPPRSPAASPRSTAWTSRASGPRAARSRRPTCSRSWRAGRRRRAMARRWCDLSRRHRRRGGSRRSAGWI